MDNYDSSGPYITFGSSGIPFNGVSGPDGTPGAGLGPGSWTVQAYFAIGTVTVPIDPTGIADPATLGLIAGTGPGSTAGVDNSDAPLPGAFKGQFWGVPGTSAAGGQTITLEIAVYSGSSYDSANYRAHSEAFTIVTSANSSPQPNETGALMPAFAIYIPEPSAFALSSIGAAALMLLRRKKQSQT